MPRHFKQSHHYKLNPRKIGALLQRDAAPHRHLRDAFIGRRILNMPDPTALDSSTLNLPENWWDTHRAGFVYFGLDATKQILATRYRMNERALAGCINDISGACTPLKMSRNKLDFIPTTSKPGQEAYLLGCTPRFLKDDSNPDNTLSMDSKRVAEALLPGTDFNPRVWLGRIVLPRCQDKLFDVEDSLEDLFPTTLWVGTISLIKPFESVR